MSFITREYKFETSYNMQQQQQKDQRRMAIRSLKKLIKPVLRLIKKKQLLKKTLAELAEQQNAVNASLEDMRKNSTTTSAENMANEQLVERLYNDMRESPKNAAIIVQQGTQQRVVPVHPEQSFIPVHFARTSSGTFFWTSVEATRQQELQLREQYDRWVQA